MMMQNSGNDIDRHNLQPKKFIMWLFLISSIIFFAGLTSGFIVYTGSGRVLNVQLPKIFGYSSIVILLSSATLYWASQQTKRLNFTNQRIGLWLTFFLGIAFIAMQIYGWKVWTELGVYFINSNASISFVYAFTFLHILHILAGLIIIITALVSSYGKVPNVINSFRMQITSIFWHFVDILWIYLYLFLLLNQ
ncbi:cytochrome c oxidase, subunit III [Pseudopedobacter saltans DSM 12145]|uniref:Cytochrome c oxidase, subunit III n=1 Tax=Pseudopedobacter saltans (strain ATCC 51119 / DSM 12145 / JCM 21818 / CCUG 39354 / LMG 10337 / NBRC 100064 / NCIMB 13643) TaxID=762903 RepID=F0S5J6_PSESL|nr:cytochrome c oxidase subunit 3 [Pseudopedobacter saltans]ADY53160.1 cytochrome c oxidase, subunit III [Pseudopedobacter saltans DSM 12145]